ncbi:hypothetical protein ACFQ88_27090 [Paenibacillus sp. NPDC056579]|uniref:hypothetical protein n=1 Tax=unclassified Paenibacillus TaxID=185978 RepID=UPI001EF8CD27|nr:hypothetical protein [Paenibacillus sp. H1-7]ULL13059.1 hypothetical protein DVH26_00350 [Paenibacillus sp. H1-7]
MNNQFIAYVGDDRVHDSYITSTHWENHNFSVSLRGYEGELVVLTFCDVQMIHSNKPIGMMLYAVSVMKESEPFRKFIFTNWDELDCASLEIVAKSIEVEVTVV